MSQIYSEKISSTGTRMLFLCLSILFLVMFGWRISIVGWRFFPALSLFLGLLFGFYVLNYRTLEISITSESLKLKFGLISWKTRLDNIQACQRDDSPPLVKYGGAGVHFAFVKGTYRAFYNFLEYPRILVTFRKKQGLVQELVFTTRQPEKILALLQQGRE